MCKRIWTSINFLATKYEDFELFLSAFVTYLSRVAGVEFPPNPQVYCIVICTMIFSGFLCSTLLVISMTFDRFYSILMPLQAASFNTVKRAKITIVCIYLFSIIYNLPQAFLVSGDTYECIPYGKASNVSYGMPYYWLSFIVHYALPFVLLLAMNSVMIHKIRTRGFSEKYTERNQTESQLQSQGHIQSRKSSSSEGQTFAILLLVTFVMLILNTPAYMLFIYIQIANITTSPQIFAEYFLFYQISFNLQVSNYGINFFLYVISGKKFRNDLVRFFVPKAVK